MAEYILSILRTQLMVVFSWGLHNPRRLPNDAGLSFQVQGFKYTGEVRVIYNQGTDLFNVELPNHKIENIYLDQLVEVIDNLIEKTENYQQRIIDEYGIH